MIGKSKKGVFSKIGVTFILLFFFSGTVCAAVVRDNVYQVKKRSYAVEPEAQKLTISSQDQAFLLKPTISSYTLLNPLAPRVIYTIPPYPQSGFLPKLGKWMTVKTLDSRPVYLLLDAAAKNAQAKMAFVPAHWISLLNPKGQYIIEPINYVFVVYESNKKQPVDLLNAVLRTVGFPGTASKNHSGGYYAYIGDQLLGQLTSATGQILTYSNGDFQFQNDHFRVFGTYHFKMNNQPVAIFVASVSEESGFESAIAQLPPEKLKLKLQELNRRFANGTLPYENYGHHFVSFAGARNNLAVALIKAGYATYYSSLGNVVNTRGESTEDHDGNVYVTVIQ